MRKVFLIVPTGVNGHAEVERVGKLDLEDLRLFLGHDDVDHRYVRNGRPMRQLPFLTLSVLQTIRKLEGGTHFGVPPESGTQQEFLERRLRRNSLEGSRSNVGLKICRMQEFLGPKKDLLVPIPHVRPIGWSGTE